METDGVEEGFEGMVRAAVTAGARFGESWARMREQLAREAEAQSLQQARELQSRFEAERRAAVGELRNVHKGEWWDQAKPEDIGRTYATAQAWQEKEPEAATARDRMNEELATRYGVDVNQLNADPARVQEHLARMEAERLESAAREERRKEQQDRGAAAGQGADGDQLKAAAERSAATVELAPEPADQERAAADAELLQGRESQTRGESGMSYDSAERHGAMAAELETKGIDERTLETRMRADISQGKPATEAIKQDRGTKARKGRAQTGGAKEVSLGR